MMEMLMKSTLKSGICVKLYLPTLDNYLLKLLALLHIILLFYFHIKLFAVGKGIMLYYPWTVTEIELILLQAAQCSLMRNFMLAVFRRKQVSEVMP